MSVWLLVFQIWCSKLGCVYRLGDVRSSVGFEPTSLIKYQRSTIELGGYTTHIVAHAEHQIHPNIHINHQSTPINAPAPDRDDWHQDMLHMILEMQHILI